MYVEGVKRDSKYTIGDHNIFAHNFINIQLICNLKKVLESWFLGLSNHTMKSYVCWSMPKMLNVKNSFDAFDIDGWKALILSFPRLFGLKIS